MRARRSIAVGVLALAAFSSTVAGFAIAGSLGKASAASTLVSGPVSPPVSGPQGGNGQGQNQGGNGQGQNGVSPPPLSVTYTVNCPVLFVTVPVTVNFVSKAPQATHPGAPVTLSGVGITLSLPANVVNLSIQELGFTSLGAQVTADDINATNTTEGTVNATPTPVDFTVNLVANQPFVQVLSTPTTVGPWTAGRSGTITFTPGDLDLTLIAPGGLSVSSVCTPAATPTLGTTVIR